MTNIFDEPKILGVKVFPVRTQAVGNVIEKLIDLGGLSDDSELIGQFLVRLDKNRLDEIWSEETKEFKSPEEVNLVAALINSFDETGGHLSDGETVLFQFHDGWDKDDTMRASAILQELQLTLYGVQHESPEDIKREILDYISKKKEQLGVD